MTVFVASKPMRDVPPQTRPNLELAYRLASRGYSAKRVAELSGVTYAEARQIKTQYATYFFDADAHGRRMQQSEIDRKKRDVRRWGKK